MSERSHLPWIPIGLAIVVGVLLGLGIAPALSARAWFVHWEAVGSLATAVAILFAALALREQRRASDLQDAATRNAVIESNAALKHATQSANAMAMTIELFREWRAADSVKARRRIYDEIVPHKQVPLNDIPESLRSDIIRVVNFCDLLGLLVHHKLVNYPIIAGYLGDAILRLGDHTLNSIKLERQRRLAKGDSGHYQEHFEHLVNLLQKEPQGLALPKV